MRQGEPVTAYCPSLNNSVTLLVKGSRMRRQPERHAVWMRAGPRRRGNG